MFFFVFVIIAYDNSNFLLIYNKTYSAKLFYNNLIKSNVDPFEIKSGLKQRDVLSLALFNLVLQKIVTDESNNKMWE